MYIHTSLLILHTTQYVPLGRASQHSRTRMNQTVSTSSNESKPVLYFCAFDLLLKYVFNVGSVSLRASPDLIHVTGPHRNYLIQRLCCLFAARPLYVTN